MFNKEDSWILRSLARQLKTASLDPVNEEKRQFWYHHTALKGQRPAVFVHPDGSWAEFLPPAALKCTGGYARHLEYILRQRLFRHEHIHDDVPIEGSLPVHKVIYNTMWGEEPHRIDSSAAGAWKHKPIIEKPSDWQKLRQPRVSHDDKASQERLEATGNLLGDLLELKYVGVTSFSCHIMHYYCDYRGMENMFLDLVLEPEMVHEQIRFFTDGIISMYRQIEDLGLVSLNNDDTFHYTGGIGYNKELPGQPFDPENIKLHNVWGAAEAQEFSSVSPAMHEEFILQYEREVLALFGLNGYGCCDDLADKLDGVLQIKNLRRVAVCPWADISRFRPVLGDRYIMTWKPQPAFLSHENMPVADIAHELATGVAKARGGRLELILRDTHTVRKDPARFNQWIDLARQAIAENWH